MIEMAMAAAVTVSLSGLSYAALKPDTLVSEAEIVADRATCRTVDSAIVAFVGVNGVEPTAVAQLASYVKGDISRYSVIGGVAAGPGC
ncbi:hypothetical protein [Actinoplanes sp. NPDC051851]|uniref:hypothetical protein n=1 Tax=Actinoplanes sp. NPDC051851 TaxID=3154753 RepID=UPI003425E409